MRARRRPVRPSAGAAFARAGQDDDESHATATGRGRSVQRAPEFIRLGRRRLAHAARCALDAATVASDAGSAASAGCARVSSCPSSSRPAAPRQASAAGLGDLPTRQQQRVARLEPLRRVTGTASACRPPPTRSLGTGKVTLARVVRAVGYSAAAGWPTAKLQDFTSAPARPNRPDVSTCSSRRRCIRTCSAAGRRLDRHARPRPTGDQDGKTGVKSG